MFHVANCPRLIADEAEAQGYLRIALDSKQCKRLRSFDRTIAELLTTTPSASEIAADQVRGTLGAIALKALPPGRDHHAPAQQSVKRALAWLDEHLHEQVGIQAAASSIGVSVAHLRRLCHQVTGRSPRILLEELRLTRACDLLRRTDDTLDAIAEACGYASASALSQAFTRRFAIRPGAWRRSDQPSSIGQRPVPGSAR